MKPTPETVPFSEIRALLLACERIDLRGNKGEYGAMSACPTIHKYRELRLGIMFYSSGHGWRVRKEPRHWREVFNERYGARMEEMTA